MDYKELYDNAFNATFQERECFFKNKFVQAKNEGQTFNHTYNELLRKSSEYVNTNYGYLKQDPYLDMFNLFNKKFSIYENDQINKIVTVKIIPLLEKSNIILPKTFIELVCEIAKFDAYAETSRIMANNFSLYKLMFDLNDFSKFKLISYNSRIENVPLFEKLHSKLYPLAKPRKSKPSKDSFDDEEFLNVNEVAELTNYAVATIYDLKHKGKIPFYKKGAKLQFKKSEILDWLEQGKGITKDDLNEKANEYIFKNT